MRITTLPWVHPYVQHVCDLWLSTGLGGLVFVALLDWQDSDEFAEAGIGIDNLWSFTVPIYALGRSVASLYRNAHHRIVCDDWAIQNVICELDPNRAHYCCKGSYSGCLSEHPPYARGR